MNRPLGSKLLGTIAVVAGLLKFLSAFVVMSVVGDGVVGLPPTAVSSGFVAFALLALGFIGTGWGLATLWMQPWAWPTGIVVGALDVVLAVAVVLLSGAASAVIPWAIALVVSAIIEYGMLHSREQRTIMGYEHGFKTPKAESSHAH